MTVPEAQKDRYLRRYRLRRHRLPVAGGTLSIVAPQNSDDLLTGERGRQVALHRMPYWAEIWPASVGLARQLLRGPRLDGCQAMDLGCGIGLPGIAAGIQGAEVFFVDREPDALHFARFNADQNGVCQHRQVRLDWSRATCAHQCDLLLLADVAYERRNYEPIRRHLRQCLRPTGHALLADPYREAASTFLEELALAFDLEVTDTSTAFPQERIPLRIARIHGRTAH